MSYYHLWGQPFTTSGWQNYPNGWVYTGGIGMPTARLDYFGNRPIRVHSFGDFYVTGAGSYMRMNYGGNLVDNGGIGHFGSSGGSFQWEAHQGNISNQMFFGRDQPAGRSVTSFNDGFVWAGTLAGSLYWDQVPNPPGINVWVEGRDIHVQVIAPDNGGTGITAYNVQLSFNGGGWGNDRGGGSTVYNSMAAGNYQARTWAANAVGSSQPAYSGIVTVRAGGKRYNGTSFNPTATAKRFNGTAWVDLSTAKRYTGSSWVDLA